MRNKMITLCPTTYELAKKMPNFSEWVRRMVLENGEATGKTKPDRELLHRECDTFVVARWQHMMDGTYAYFGFCETCGHDVTWKVKQ